MSLADSANFRPLLELFRGLRRLRQLSGLDGHWTEEVALTEKAALATGARQVMRG